MSKVVLIGCGNVGMSYAYALMNQKTSLDELVLIDLDKEKIIGEVMDLNHCLPFSTKKLFVKAGEYSDCSNADIVVIAAGANQLVGETRMDLIKKNSVIFKKIIDEVMNSGFDGIFLIATNPLDVMTYLTYKYSGLNHKRVIGSGTSLDTSRLRYIISNKLNISPKNVHAYVMGEHGDSEFVPWSNASIGLQKISDFLTKEEMDKIAVEVKDAAYDIIKRKGATYYGIGMCLVRITNAILDNENSIITVSSYDGENEIYIGVPTIINRDGAREVIKLNLIKEEQDKYNQSTVVIRKAINSVLITNEIEQENLFLIEKYFKDKSLNPAMITKFIKPFETNKDISNEFAYYLKNNSFIKNSIVETGYTAEQLHSMFKTKLDISGVFSLLVTLRVNPNLGMRYIKEGI